jgi:phosphoribosylformimino-5-aminoimidazole carboxamide ribotide isomerase
MNLYPAIDILDGRAVRLRQGRRDALTDYGTPLEMARRWAALGAEWLHVVDLDGAFDGSRANVPVFESICRELPDIRIQTGGGIRDLETAERLIGGGVSRIVLGTATIEDPELLSRSLERFPGRVAVSIDARDGIARVAGWTRASPSTALELAQRVEAAGVDLVVYTDITRDGEFTGVNLDATRGMLEATRLRVIASGGVTSLSDIRSLRDLGHPRLEGAVIGKALYEGRIDLEEAFAVSRAG